MSMIRPELLEALQDVERAAREVDCLFGGDGPGGWTIFGLGLSDEAAAPFLMLHDYLNDVSRERAT